MTLIWSNENIWKKKIILHCWILRSFFLQSLKSKRRNRRNILKNWVSYYCKQHLKVNLTFFQTFNFYFRSFQSWFHFVVCSKLLVRLFFFVLLPILLTVQNVNSWIFITGLGLFDQVCIFSDPLIHIFKLKIKLSFSSTQLTAPGLCSSETMDTSFIFLLIQGLNLLGETTSLENWAIYEVFV